jgi:thiol-disulfide isomerase/thioredoxin
VKPSIRRPGRAGLVLAAALALSGLLVATAGRAQGDVRLPGLRGGELTSRDLASGATVVVVWASWSPRCRDIVARANAIAGRWGGQARVVTVDFQESAEEVEKFLAGKSLQPPVYLDRDGEFAKAHAIATLPGLIVFKDGQARYQGKLPADADGAIAEALR